MNREIDELSILIVNGSPVFIRALRELIFAAAEKKIYTVDAAFTAKEALKKAASASYRYIFLDSGISDGETRQEFLMQQLKNKCDKIVATSFHKSEGNEQFPGSGILTVSDEELNIDTIASIIL